MNIVLISIVIFVLTLAASYAGLETQKRLADEHKTDQVARRRSSSGGACQPSPGTGSWNPDWRQLCLFLRSRNA